MKSCTFTNDGNIKINLIDDPKSNLFSSRDNHEVLFRRINTYLINKKIITKNIIDLGAWIGDNSIPWAKNIDGIVYAIDPSPTNIKFINDMCAINDIENIKCIERAISDKCEIVSTNDCIDHCSFVYNNSANNGKNKFEAVSLDYLHEQNILNDIGYIHLDVEGMEFRILQGSTNIIDKFRPVITFEQHLQIDDYDVILNFLKGKNYITFLINEVLPGCRTDCRNSISFPQEIYTEDIIEQIHNMLKIKILILK